MPCWLSAMHVVWRQPIVSFQIGIKFPLCGIELKGNKKEKKNMIKEIHSPLSVVILTTFWRQAIVVHKNHKQQHMMNVFPSLLAAVFLLSSTRTYAQELKSNASTSTCKVGCFVLRSAWISTMHYSDTMYGEQDEQNRKDRKRRNLVQSFITRASSGRLVRSQPREM